MIAQMLKRDFRNVTHFPGTHGNTLDRILHAMDDVERVPSVVFALLLLAPAAVGGLGDLTWTGALWLLMVVDWAVLRALPRFGRSYGPAKANAFILAALRVPFAWLPQPLALVAQLIGTLLVVYGFWIEPHRLTVTERTLRSPKLKPGAPVRVLHLGDLHIERWTGRERQLLDLCQRLGPDLIVFSGDFLNLSYIHDPLAQQHCREFWQALAKIETPLGVLAVTGSPAVDQETMIPALLDGLPLRWLNDERVSLRYRGQALDVIGLSCSHKPFVDAPKLAGLLDETPPSRFTLLLYHSPDLAPDAAELGIDLQLSGHTHAGQVRLPGLGPLMTGSLYGRDLESGLKQLGALTLYVTRGIGLEGKGAPRLRFLAPPEVIVWDLDGE
jgi:hypothetical protein